MELIRKEIIVRESARVDQNEEVIKHFFIPVRLNMLNVMPIIFMSTILQLVQMLSLVGIKTQILILQNGLLVQNRFILLESSYIVPEFSYWELCIQILPLILSQLQLI